MAMTLITTNTSSDAATSDFTSSIDSTYKLYIFKFYDVNPATDNVNFSFQVNEYVCVRVRVRVCTRVCVHVWMCVW